MNFASISTRITRAIHGIAVQAHIKSLSLAVSAADARARKVSSSADRADSIAIEARKNSVAAHVKAGIACQEAANIRLAAETEASSIGGAL